jgi:hypothetical protein
MSIWYHRPGTTQKLELDRDNLIRDVILTPALNLGRSAAPFNFNSLDDQLVEPDAEGIENSPTSDDQRRTEL